MQKRGAVDRGFVLAVVLILGVVLVVSFFNHGSATGLYTSAGDGEESANADCPARAECGTLEVGGFGDIRKSEQEAISSAEAACEAEKQKVDKTEISKCLGDAVEACFKADCIPLMYTRNTLSRPCKVDYCTRTIVRGGLTYDCYYIYDNGERRLNECSSSRETRETDGERWKCSASDGGYYGSVFCEPLPKQQKND